MIAKRSRQPRPRTLLAHTSGVPREHASARTALLLLTSLLLGTAIGAFWASRPKESSIPMAPSQSSNSSAVLSQKTKTILEGLTSPVELRFYSVLDPASAPESLRLFAARVDQLLATYQTEANRKILVTRSNSQSYANMNAAITDGMKPFNEDKGEPSFLGIAVIKQNQKTALSELQPEWESALEPDITRAILTTLNVAPLANPVVAAVAKPNTAALQEVKQAIPNLDSISVADGTRLLREASLKEFAAAANQLQAQLQDAQQRLKDAQNSGSESDQQAAMKNLQQVQTDLTEQLKKIAAKGQAQVEALKQLKSGG